MLMFDVMNCGFCAESVLAKEQANCALPVGEKIVGIDTHSGDPRLAGLRTMEYGGGHILPTTLEIEDRHDMMNGRRPVLVILSVLDDVHMKAFIKAYKNII